MANSRTYYLLILLAIGFLSGCRPLPTNIKNTGDALLYPDYCGITVPPNIAPLNFNIQNPDDLYILVFLNHTTSREIFRIRARKGLVRIPAGSWRKALQVCQGNGLTIDIYGMKNKMWKKYSAVTMMVANEEIDPYLVYRLIEPGYESWNKMGIYQRELGNFKEKTIIRNEMTKGNCMNCHSFCRNSPENMLFHARGQAGGTVIARNNELYKVNTKSDGILSAGVYPAWHPGSRYVAFSVNHIVQSFHSLPGKRVEVVDTLSDLILYDAEYNKVIQCPAISRSDAFETFPAWSGDGKYLYYISAVNTSYRNFQDIRYNLLRLSFDESTGTFGSYPDTMIAADKDNYSVSLPRISPDGRYLMYSRSAFGNFTIWHDDSDLEILDLEKNSIMKPDINSPESESYHSWSSNGRWIIFSSRRVNGLYTNLYLSYFDHDGICHKPFLLPQENPEYNELLPKSYNVPELITGKIKYSPHELAKAVLSNARQASAD